MSEAQYVRSVDNVVPTDLCARVCAFLDKYISDAEDVSYGTGENTSCKKITLSADVSSSDPAFATDSISVRNQLVEFLTRFMRSSIIPHTYPILEPVFAPLEIRKMLGPTRQHSDNVSPFLLDSLGQTRIAYRVVSLVLTMSESADVLYFPNQEKRMSLKRGSIAVFPPYWMFEHSSIDAGIPRYAVTTWLNETCEAKKASFLALR